MNENINEALNDFIYFNPLFSWNATFDRQIPYKKFTGRIGLSMYGVAAENSFYEKWHNIYGGIHLGLSYKIQKFSVGFASYPAIKLLSSLEIFSVSGGLGGGRKEIGFNIDLSPNISYSFNEKLDVKLNYFYGLNEALKTGENLNYKINALRIGITYNL